MSRGTGLEIWSIVSFDMFPFGAAGTAAAFVDVLSELVPPLRCLSCRSRAPAAETVEGCRWRGRREWRIGRALDAKIVEICSATRETNGEREVFGAAVEHVDC